MPATIAIPNKNNQPQPHSWVWFGLCIMILLMVLLAVTIPFVQHRDHTKKSSCNGGKAGRRN